MEKIGSGKFRQKARIIPNSCDMSKKKPQSIQVPKYIRFGMKALETLSVYLAFKVAWSLFFRPIRFPYNVREKELLKKASIEKRLLSNKQVFHLLRWGKGDQAVVLMHGWSGRGTQMEAIIERLVEHNFEVFAIEPPGHGLSPGNKTNMLEFQEALHLVKEEFPQIRFAVGHSLGGIASTLEQKRHQSFERIVIIGSPSNMTDLIHRFCNSINVSGKVELRLRNHLEEKYQIQLDDFSGFSIVESVHVPGLIIHDEDDADVDYRDALHFQQHWKNSEVMITKGQGHRRVLRDKQVIERIISFLGKH
jgi:pimeloyl-ACP methyl ester carboxylesterase